MCLTTWLDTGEEKISEFEDRSIEIIQTEPQRGKEMKGEKKNQHWIESSRYVRQYQMV